MSKNEIILFLNWYVASLFPMLNLRTKEGKQSIEVLYNTITAKNKPNEFLKKLIEKREYQKYIYNTFSKLPVSETEILPLEVAYYSDQNEFLGYNDNLMKTLQLPPVFTYAIIRQNYYNSLKKKWDSTYIYLTTVPFSKPKNGIVQILNSEEAIIARLLDFKEILMQIEENKDRYNWDEAMAKRKYLTLHKVS